MILKVLDYRQGEKGVIYDEWNYFDNIVSASNYYDEGSKTVVVRCRFRDESDVTFSIPHLAYLMSDTGKTIEKIVPAEPVEIDENDPVYKTLQDAVDKAMKG